MHVEARNNLTAANKRGGKMILSLISGYHTRAALFVGPARAGARAHNKKAAHHCYVQDKGTFKGRKNEWVMYRSAIISRTERLLRPIIKTMSSIMLSLSARAEFPSRFLYFRPVDDVRDRFYH